jgi:lipopolysaccharide heptosyltransferase II
VKILIVQPRRIGDVIVTTPVIDALRSRFPDARIEFLVEKGMAPVLEGYPGLDEALVFEKSRFWFWLREIRRRRYDWVLDFMNNPRTAQLTWASRAPVRAGFETPFWGLVYTHRVARPPRPLYAVQIKFNLLRRLGLTPGERVLPRIPLSAADFAPAAGWWADRGLDAYPERIAVLPMHRRPIRQWPLARFAETVQRLLAVPDRAVLLFGGPEERRDLEKMAGGFPRRVFAIPPGGLRQAAALLSRCHAAVTNDSGLMHLSVAVGLPTVTVYGPTWPESWNPRAAPHRYVQARGLTCLGCNRDQCPFGHECMDWVSVDRVVAEAEAVLAERRVGTP